MSRIVWDQPGERFYEAGVDQGVLFVDPDLGVPWNGLISVAESNTDTEPNSYYLDGQKYLTVPKAGDFEATIQAYTYPDEFSPCDGYAPVLPGLYVGEQPRKSFSMCYRTLVGNDTQGESHGYKLHFIYNAVVQPTERSNGTLSESPQPTPFEWHLSSTPVPISGYKLVSHLFVDSRTTDPSIMTNVENIVYGDDLTAPRMPTPDELIDIFYDYFNVDGGTPGSTELDVLDGGAA